MLLRRSLLLICLILPIAACQAPKVHEALSPESRAAMQGSKLIGATEAKPELDRSIRKRGIVVAGGGLIGLAVGLTATAISAAVENAASDIDAVPGFEADIAMLVEDGIGKRLEASTGVEFVASDSINDPNRSFSFTDDGKDALLTAAKQAGHQGQILDVRSDFSGIVSSGIRQAGAETFTYVTRLRAQVVDVKSGAVLAKSVCDTTVPAGTLEDVKRNVKEYPEAYAKALEAAAEAADAEDAHAQPAEPAKLPPETYLSEVVDRLAQGCINTLHLRMS